MGVFKDTLTQATAQFGGHEIVVQNSWKFIPMKTWSALTVDGIVYDENTKFETATPHKPQMSAKNISDTIKSIEVYFAGVFRVKISIVVNGEVLHKDELSEIDELHVRLTKDG